MLVVLYLIRLKFPTQPFLKPCTLALLMNTNNLVFCLLETFSLVYNFSGCYILFNMPERSENNIIDYEVKRKSKKDRKSNKSFFDKAHERSSK